MYLDPNDLSLVDEISTELRIKRSQIIRDLATSVANAYAKTAAVLKSDRKPRLTTWLQLAGVERSMTGDLGLRVDEIYNEAS